MIRFEWDARKAASNLRKHAVSFEEAESTFYDDFALQFYDEEGSSSEDRFVLLGRSALSRVLVVVHCEREGGEVIRIISARKATARERRHYTGK